VNRGVAAGEVGVDEAKAPFGNPPLRENLWLRSTPRSKRFANPV
jgi:hypothetical protein